MSAGDCSVCGEPRFFGPHCHGDNDEEGLSDELLCQVLYERFTLRCGDEWPDHAHGHTDCFLIGEAIKRIATRPRVVAGQPRIIPDPEDKW